MTKEEKVAYWLDLADYDIETGRLVCRKALAVCGFHVPSGDRKDTEILLVQDAR
ncbi:MAG: hypothetical protein K6A94_04815 [Bacteroidales bacterium]|nr:hypothetical protein [Bacteroidales bacterium]